MKRFSLLNTLLTILIKMVFNNSNMVELYSLYQIDDCVQRVIQTVRYIKKSSDNLEILKYLYRHYNEYCKEFLKYLLMTMEENAITGIHSYRGKEMSNTNLYFLISN